MNRHDELAKPKDAQVPKDYVHLPEEKSYIVWDYIAYALAFGIWLLIVISATE